ncbi:hypothetical protein FSARC_5200 [Fusarium sarcochroum]|uniref:Xylanolytic transcriptional activator regulatory domain-containing protein n=1 Tax=Fusarium sarcochroum TaxID=1208366 RepID=A0A8H4TZW0_9HYPO|nr:hypothetical protein FSARC_5200 [Fusarium sarcochroum]
MISPQETYIPPERGLSQITDGGFDAPLGLDQDDESTQEDTPNAPLQEDQYGHLHGGASEFAFLHFAKQKLSSLPSMSIDFCDYPLTGSGSSPCVLPPKAIADELIRNYFDFGLSTSRFVHQPSFRESYEQLYGVNAGVGLDHGTLALIYMIMALGSHYSKVNNTWCGYSASVQFYDMAKLQLEKQSSHSTFASLQARLLFTHYLLNHSRMHEAWSIFGIVVRQAQALGIHRRSTRPTNNHIIHEYRKRLFWVIYINDRVLSSIFGRPCAIHDDDVDQEECTLANDEEITVSTCQPVSDDTFCSAAALVHYARLARILGKILGEFYRPASKSRTMTQLSESATEIDRLLNVWQDSLPPYLNYVVLPPSALSIITQRQMCTLKLSYAHASLLLYRPFILYSMESTVRKTSNLEVWVKRCHDKSIVAAKMVVNECNYLYQRGLFTRAFWMVNYVQFAAVGTLYMHSHLWPEATHVRDIAEEARAQFPVGVEGDFVGQRYVEMLDELSKVTSSPAPIPQQSFETPDMAVDFDVSTLDLTMPWSNLFFDPYVFEEYAGNETAGN